MKTKKTITAICAGLMALASASTSMAETKEDYIKTFGMIMFERNGLLELEFTPEEFDAFVAGMKAVNESKKLPDDIQATGAKAFEFLRARAEANAAKAAEKATAQAAEFWKELEKKEGIEKSPTGLAIEIIQKGDAKLPSENSNVVVKYTGKLVDGTVFDSTDKHGGKPAEFNLARVIAGFREGLQKIGKGGKARLYIPAKLGYGNQALPGIPPNSTLIFLSLIHISEPTRQRPKRLPLPRLPQQNSAGNFLKIPNRAVRDFFAPQISEPFPAFEKTRGCEWRAEPARKQNAATNKTLLAPRIFK